MLRVGIVEDDFEFEFTKSTLTGYAGLAVKGVFNMPDGYKKKTPSPAMTA